MARVRVRAHGSFHAGMTRRVARQAFVDSEVR